MPDLANGFSYWATNCDGNQADIVQVKLSDFTQQNKLSLTSGAVLNTGGAFGAWCDPGKFLYVV